MTRRLIFTTALIATLGGVALPALAADGNGRHEICVMGTSGPNSGTEGLCVWVPAELTPNR